MADDEFEPDPLPGYAEGHGARPASLAGIGTRRLQDEIETYLRHAIGSKLYSAGDRLPTERELTRRFHAPRGVVRGALARLTRDGLLSRRIGSGTFVNGASTKMQLPSAEISLVGPSDILEARCAIEVGYLDLVVARAREVDFQRMEAQLSLMAKATDQRSFRMAGYGFHLCVAEASRNPLIVAMQQQIMSAREAVGWSTIRRLNDTAELRRSQVDQLQEMVKALRSRDTSLAVSIASKELEKFITSIIR